MDYPQGYDEKHLSAVDVLTRLGVAGACHALGPAGLFIIDTERFEESKDVSAASPTLHTSTAA
jgi:hypothetical protein